MPCKEYYEQQINAVSAKMDELKKEIEAQQVKIDTQKEAAGKGPQDKRSELMEKRGALIDEKKKLQAQKGEVIDAQKKGKEALREDRTKLREMKNASKDFSEKAIDARLAELQNALEFRNTPLSLKEEKKMMQEIKKLKAERPTAIKHDRELAALQSKIPVPSAAEEGAAAPTEGAPAPAAGADATKNILDGLSAQIKALDAQVDEVHKELDVLNKEREGHQEKMQPLIDQRKELKEKMGTFALEKKGLIGERKAAFDEYYENQRDVRAKQQKQWEQEKAQWDLEAKKDAELRRLDEPHERQPDLILMEQTIDYCKQLMPKIEAVEAEKKPELDGSAFQGFQMMASKKDRASEGAFLSGIKGRKALKTGAGKAAGEGVTKSKAIKHTAGTLESFTKLKMKAPTTTADLPDLVTKLEAACVSLKEEIAAWEVERQAKITAAAELKADEVAEGEGEPAAAAAAEEA